MKKWALLLYTILIAISLCAGAEEFFSEESFAAAAGFSEECIFEETDFDGNELLFTDRPEESPLFQDVTVESAVEERSLYTVAPDLEYGEKCQNTEEDYWKAKPILYVDASKKGKITLAWDQYLYVAVRDVNGKIIEYIEKKSFPKVQNGNIRYCIYEVLPSGEMIQVGKPLSDRTFTYKGYDAYFNESYEEVFHGGSMTLSPSSGSHTYVVRAEKQTRSKDDKKLYIEEYGEMSEPMTAVCQHSTLYKISNFRYQQIGSPPNLLKMSFVSDYDLVNRSNQPEDSDGWFELVVKYEFLNRDYDWKKNEYVTKKGRTKAVYRADVVWDPNADPASLGYNAKGKGFGNPVVCNLDVDFGPYGDIRYYETTEVNPDPDSPMIDLFAVTLTKGNFTLQYVVPKKDKYGNYLYDVFGDMKTVVKTKVTGKLDINYSVSDEAYIPVEWKTPSFSLTPAQQHTADLCLVPDANATEYVLSGFVNNLSIMQNRTLNQVSYTFYDAEEEKPRTVTTQILPSNDPIYDDYKDFEWVVVNTKAKTIVQGLNPNSKGELLLSGLEIAGKKSTAKITVQPKQTVFKWKMSGENESASSFSQEGKIPVGKANSSGKSTAKTITLQNYWMMAPLLFARQIGDRMAQLEIRVWPGTEQVSIAGFRSAVNVKIDRTGAEPALVLAAADPKKPYDIPNYTVGDVRFETENGTDMICFTIEGEVKKAGKIQFAVIPVNKTAKGTFEKGEKASIQLEVTAAGYSSAVDVQHTLKSGGHTVTWKHINPNVVRYVVSAVCTNDKITGTQAHNIRTKTIDRVEKEVPATAVPGDTMSTELDFSRVGDFQWTDASILIEGFTADGARLATVNSLD